MAPHCTHHLISCDVLECSELLATAEPDLSIAAGLLQGARQNDDANRDLNVLTAPSIEIKNETEALIAAHRLRQNKPQYPLLSIRLARESGALPKLISALAASKTLTSLSADHLPPSPATSALALQLQSIPTLRAADLTWFADDVVLELLQSRKNWSRIHLPTQRETASKVSAFASLNRTDFQLHLKAPIEAADLNRWLADPHLTHLNLGTGHVPAACFDALYSCQNLTSLVRFVWFFFFISHSHFSRSCGCALVRSWMIERCQNCVQRAFHFLSCTSLCCSHRWSRLWTCSPRANSESCGVSAFDALRALKPRCWSLRWCAPIHANSGRIAALSQTMRFVRPQSNIRLDFSATL
jgi:hypothetical protein